MISKFANLAINLLCPTLSKSMSTFKSSPSGSVFVIIPSPNFLWNTFTPSLYLDKSIFVVLAVFPSPLKKLSAVLPKDAFLPKIEFAAATVFPGRSFIE